MRSDMELSNHHIEKSNKPSRRIYRLADDFMSMESQDAKESDQVGYIARSMVLATLPHSKPKEHFFQRTNGYFTISMIGNPNIGLPYGSLPRLAIAWMTREVKIKESPVLFLGKSFSVFLDKLQLSHSGGSRSDRARLREQMIRLFSTQISCVYRDNKKGHCHASQFLITRSFDLWWSHLGVGSQCIADNSTITLSQEFYQELINRPIPIDLRMLHALRKSPLQMDIYQWLTYRFFKLKKPSLISWNALASQFGSNYANTKQGLRDFKREFKKALDVVLKMYRDANVDLEKQGICLKPSKTHVKSCLKEVV